MNRAALLAFALLPALAACGRAEEESTANKADRVEREMNAFEATIRARTANDVADVERTKEQQASDQLNSLNAAAARSADEAAPASGNGAR